MTRGRLILLILIVVGLILLFWGPVHRSAAALPDGMMLGPDTWERAEGLLPEAILERYRSGDYRNPVLDLERRGLRRMELPPDLLAASRKNAGRFVLNADGSIVFAEGGARPAFIEGLPFPDVDAADPDAGTKIVWNYFYAQWYRGNSHFLTELVMLGRSGVERRLVNDVRMRCLDGAPEARRTANPENLVMQTLRAVGAEHHRDEPR